MTTKINNDSKQELDQLLDENELDQVAGGFPADIRQPSSNNNEFVDERKIINETIFNQ